MLRLLIFLLLICAVAFGVNWFVDHPGEVDVIWQGTEYDFSLTVALGIFIGAAVALVIVWSIFRFVVRAPSLVALSSRMRRREKGFNALSRGLIALGSGDGRAAQRHAADARKLLGQEPLARFLIAQAAQLNGDRNAATAAFNEMLEHEETHALGLRGLHLEARRAGDHAAALEYAQRANKYAALPWAAQAVLDDRAQHGDWAAALATVESNAAKKLIDKPTANRWRAVLKTAIAQESAERDPKGALTLALEAIALAPGLVPAAALAGKLLGAASEYQKASKVLETAFSATPHPDLAAVYLRVRHGDSTQDRLARARALARAAPFAPESQMTIARAAIDARDTKAARQALNPLLRGDAGQPRATVRICLLMAEIEEIEGNGGAVREWLNRAARAPRDRAWVAEGVISDHWAPVTPAGVIDGFVWKTPDERLTAMAAPAPVAVAPAALVIQPPPAPPAPPPPAPAAVEPAPPVPAVAPAPAPTSPAAAEPAANAAARPAATAAPAGNVVMLPSAAPDDPGPHKSEIRSGYRFFASE
jgi:HemY protein